MTKRTMKLNNVLTGKIREITLPNALEVKAAKPAAQSKSEGGNSGKNKR